MSERAVTSKAAHQYCSILEMKWVSVPSCAVRQSSENATLIVDAESARQLSLLQCFPALQGIKMRTINGEDEVDALIFTSSRADNC